MPAARAPSSAPPAGRALREPLVRLYESPDLPAGKLPPALAQRYGGALGLPAACVYGNFVGSLDGVVALGPKYPSSGSVISGRAPADRFVMALLRACADVVLIGAGTLRATPRHRWTPEHVWPAGAAQFATLREQRGRTTRPVLAVVTASGAIPAHHPALQDRTLVITTGPGRRRLDGRLPPACTVAVAGDQPPLSMGRVLALLRENGHRCVLTEGGPRLLAQLIDDHTLDELFLTVAPVLAGRDTTPRPGLVSGLELLPGRRETAQLASVRRSGSYLFLRYRFTDSKETCG